MATWLKLTNILEEHMSVCVYMCMCVHREKIYVKFNTEEFGGR